MIVTYPDTTSFHDGLYQLVRLGLTFHANAKDFTITLLGGY